MTPKDVNDTEEVHDTWVVIPLYNEEQVIGDVVAGVLAAFPQVVCVDDGSTDRSAALAAQAGARVVRHPLNLGQGAALQTGFEYTLAASFHAVHRHLRRRRTAPDRGRRGDGRAAPGGRG